MSITQVDQELREIAENRPLTSVRKSRSANLVKRFRYQTTIISRAIQNDIAQEIARGTGFLFVPVWLGVGAVLYFTASFEPSGLLLTLFVCVCLGLKFSLQANSAVQIAVSIMLLIAIGAGCAKFQTWRMSTPMLGGQITTEVTARIISINKSAKSYRAVLDVLQTAKPTLKYAPKRIRVTLREGAENLVSGNTIKVRLRLMPPSGPVRPTSYDFAFQAYFDGIGATGFAISPVTVFTTKPPWYFHYGFAQIERVRQAIAMRIRAVITGNEAEVAVALIAGVQAGIDETTMESLRLTGLAHILSISGLHMALVAGVFMGAVRGGFSFFPNQAARLPVKKYAALLALIASFFYLLLSGADVAALRSFIMLAVFLLAIMLDQQALTMRNLNFAAIAILVVTPHEIMGPSFQMSFAATAALISAYAFWTRTKLHSNPNIANGVIHLVWGKFWRFLIALAITSIIAGTATSLFSAWHFHRLAPMGLPANLAAMPPVSLLVMPSAVISALAMPFGLEEWPLRIMGFGIAAMLKVSNFFAQISSAGLSGALNTSPFLLAIVTLLIACILQTRLKCLALVPLPVLALMFWQPSRPDILISEDAKLVAVHVDQNKIATNQARANAFTLQSWQKALVTNAVLIPSKSNTNYPAQTFKCSDLKCSIVLNNGIKVSWLGYPKIKRSKSQPTKQLKTIETEPSNPSTNNATKEENLSVKSQPLRPIEANSIKSNEQYKHSAITEKNLSVKFNAAIDELCGQTDLLIIEGPTPPRICENTKTYIISARDLALRGSAEIYFSEIKNQMSNDANQVSYALRKIYETKTKLPYNVTRQASQITNQQKHEAFSIRYAIGQPNRPWNFERKFSRAARNLPPFQPMPTVKVNNGE